MIHNRVSPSFHQRLRYRRVSSSSARASTTSHVHREAPSLTSRSPSHTSAARSGARACISAGTRPPLSPLSRVDAPPASAMTPPTRRRGSAPASAPASAATSDASPPRPSSPDADQSRIFGDVCAICQEDVARRGALDSCAHLFCLPCIRRWAKIETRCPLCKARFSVIQPERLGDDPDHPDDPAGVRNRDVSARRSRPIRVPLRDQVYEGESELPDGVDIEDVICGTCGEGGDEPNLMLCDGCDQGHHCYCVGLDAVPLEEWHCRICADEDPGRDGEGQGEGQGEENRDQYRNQDQNQNRAAADESAAREAAMEAARARAARLRAARRRRLDPRPQRARVAFARNEFRARHDDDDGDGGGDGFGSGFASLGVRVMASPTQSVGRAPRGGFRGGGGERVRAGEAGDDARRRQIARVHELRRMWERYRNGELGFDRADEPPGAARGPGRGNVSETGGARGAREREDADDARAGSRSPGGAGKDAEEDAWAARDRAAATLARNRADDASKTAGTNGKGITGGGIDASATVGGGLKRPRLREPARRAAVGAAAAMGAAASANPPPPPGFRKLPPSSRTNDRAAGRAIGRAIVRAPLASPRAEATREDGWSDSDDDDDDGGGSGGAAAAAAVASAAAATIGSKPVGSYPSRDGWGSRDARATSFVPPGAIDHGRPRTSEERDARRRETEEAAAAAGAPRASVVLAMVKSRLKPALARGEIDRDGFKRVARAATKTATAAAAAAALRHGGGEEHDGAREEAVVDAVARAVRNALAREGARAEPGHEVV